MSAHDFAGLIQPVARALLPGDPNPKFSTARELRYGAHGSLSISLDNDTWFNHESQEGGGVIDFVRAYGSENPAEWLRANGFLTDEPMRSESPAAAYDYCNESGEVLFQVVRAKDRSFKQRKPDGAGGWEYKVRDVRQVPYRLPDLLAAPDDAIIFVVEGEKDADNVRALGLVATCNAGGAGKWRPHHAEFLRGRDVVVLPDNDDTGRDHGRKVLDSLVDIARSARMVVLPDLPLKGDVSDWIAAGGTAEALLALLPEPEATELSLIEMDPIGDPSNADGPTRAERLTAQLMPWTDDELDASREPHPHVFRGCERALFPMNEVSVVGARGREGKTTVMAAVATAVAIEQSLAGLGPMPERSVVIYSAEDDRAQFARKVAAQRAVVTPMQAEKLKARILVPDLEAPGMEALRRLVTVAERQPVTTGTDAVIVDAIAPLMLGPYPPALLIFETASTLTDTDEDNRAYVVLIDCLKRIARQLRVAVVVVHHTSQASDATLADLSISTAGIRGGTALIYNSRQNLLLVNLGSDTDPFPANDARTILRSMVAPDCQERVTALIAMETSKASDPAPVWFRWVHTDYGPAAVELDPPAHIVGKSWRKVREMAMAERGSKRDEAKAAAKNSGVDTVVRLVKDLHTSGKHPTARAVSIAAGKSPTWATPYLGQALVEGLVSSQPEKVPRTNGMQTVYRPTDSTEAAA